MPSRTESASQQELYARASKKAAQMTLLNAVIRELSRTLELNTLLQSVTDAVRQNFNYHHVMILVPQGGVLKLCAQSAEATLLLAPGHWRQLGEGIVGLVAQQRKPLLVNDVQNSPEYVSVRRQTCSELCVPILHAGELYGVLNVESTVPDQFDETDLQLLQSIAEQLSYAIRNIKLYEESRRNSEFLNKLISSSNDAIVTTDLHGRIDFWSKPAEQMLGYALRQALGKPVTEIYFAGKQEAERVMRHLRRGAKVQNWETILKKVDGSSLHASISIALLKNEAGEPVGTLGIVRDISEVRQLQEQVRRSERMATMGELSTHIAHEIRNPLSSVKLNMQILARSQELQGRAREHMNIALQEIDHLESILSEIVDFVRPHRLKKETASLPQIMDEALLMAEDALAKSEVEVVHDYTEKLQPLMLDPVRMRQVFLNLILNAIQAMEGRGRLRISIRPADRFHAAEPDIKPGAFQIAEIQDTGSGIPAGRLPQIFEPFFTTRSDGTGLGLTITKRIVEAHDGSIHVNSVEGAGTTFQVVLPAVQ